MVQANSVLLSSGYLLAVHKIRARSFWLNSRSPIQNGVFHFVVKVNHPDSIVRFVFHFVNQVQVNLLRALSLQSTRPTSFRRLVPEAHVLPHTGGCGDSAAHPSRLQTSFASMLDEAGVSTVQIQQLIGHSDYSTTANIYTHTDIQVLKKAIAKL